MVDASRPSHFRFRKRTWLAAVTAPVVLAAGTLSLFGQATSAPSSAQPRSHPAVSAAASSGVITAAKGDASRPATVSSASSVPAVPVAAPVAAPVPAALPTTAAPNPPVSALVAQVEAAGIEPGSNWSWSMGNTATYCGTISGAGTGCTYGEDGLEHTIFAGTPTLALVAHELANAETQNDAVPSLLTQVATAAAGTSWSPTDAVASCLVAHFMGFQDGAAGSWQCPDALAATVAAHIHDTQ